MRKFKLLKDLPTHPAGTVLVWCSTEKWAGGPYKGGRYQADAEHGEDLDLIFAPHSVENNPEWFVEVDKKEFSKEQLRLVAEIFYTKGVANGVGSFPLAEELEVVIKGRYLNQL